MTREIYTIIKLISPYFPNRMKTSTDVSRTYRYSVITTIKCIEIFGKIMREKQHEIKMYKMALLRNNIPLDVINTIKTYHLQINSIQPNIFRQKKYTRFIYKFIRLDYVINIEEALKVAKLFDSWIVFDYDDYLSTTFYPYKQYEEFIRFLNFVDHKLMSYWL